MVSGIFNVTRTGKISPAQNSLADESAVAGLWRAWAGRRLAVKPATGCFLSNGCLDVQAALRSLSKEVETARNNGCIGLRLLVDMSWATYFFQRVVRAAGLRRLAQRCLSALSSPAWRSASHYESVFFPSKALSLVKENHGATLDGDRFADHPSHYVAQVWPPRGSLVCLGTM